jgi:DNA-binding CsgD family transcriptional regulator
MKETRDVVRDDCGERVAKLEQRVSKLEEEMTLPLMGLQVLTTKEVAKILKVSEYTVITLTVNGYLMGKYVVTREGQRGTYRYTVDSVRDYLNSPNTLEIQMEGGMRRKKNTRQQDIAQ